MDKGGAEAVFLFDGSKMAFWRLLQTLLKEATQGICNYLATSKPVSLSNEKQKKVKNKNGFRQLRQGNA